VKNALAYYYAGVEVVNSKVLVWGRVNQHDFGDSFISSQDDEILQFTHPSDSSGVDRSPDSESVHQIPPGATSFRRSILPGLNAMIFEIVSPKYLAKDGVFFSKYH
jgi:hypothetical protein